MCVCVCLFVRTRVCVRVSFPSSQCRCDSICFTVDVGHMCSCSYCTAASITSFFFFHILLYIFLRPSVSWFGFLLWWMLESYIHYTYAVYGSDMFLRFHAWDDLYSPVLFCVWTYMYICGRRPEFLAAALVFFLHHECCSLSLSLSLSSAIIWSPSLSLTPMPPPPPAGAF